MPAPSPPRRANLPTPPLWGPASWGAVRAKAAAAAPGLVPELDRDGLSVAEAHAEIESGRSSARERARRDAEARRAAEAELDALDGD